jgi:predicted dehydrogenase
MNERKIRFALVGCGTITKKHVSALKDLDTAEIAAVCDADPEAARTLGTELGLPAYTNPDEMAQKEIFDVFSILTPSGTHAKLMLSLCHHHRHFLVEKPLALRITDADRVIQACDEHGIKVFVVQQNRYNLPVRKLKEAVDQGRFGRMVMGTVRVRWCRDQLYYDAKPWRGTWAQDGGVFTNQASHHIDMLVWMMGDVENVMAMAATRLARIEAEDTGAAILRFTSGALGIIEATTATRPKDLEGSISILGEKGSVEIAGFFMNELKTWQFSDPTPDDAEIFERWGKNPAGVSWNHREYLQGVIQSLQENKRGLVEGFEGRKSLELINAIYESAETGKMVPLLFRPHSCRLGQSD